MGEHSKLKVIGIGAGVLAVVVVSVLLTITTYEAIPDHALFLVNKSQQIVRPAFAANEKVNGFDTQATFKELNDTDHPYFGFKLPPEKEWDEFTLYGREVSVLRNLTYPPESRWDENGYWRY